FFFSSRRRHTRFSRDWSSDVCSSDLSPASGWRESKAPAHRRRKAAENCPRTCRWPSCPAQSGLPCGSTGGRNHRPADSPPPISRSEERRVGKERRARKTRRGQIKKQE